MGEQDSKGVKVGTWMELRVGVRIRKACMNHGWTRSGVGLDHQGWVGAF